MDLPSKRKMLDPNRSGIIVVPGASGKPAGNTADAIPNILRQAKNTGLTTMMKQAMNNKDVTVATYVYCRWLWMDC